MMPVVKNEWDIYKTNRSRRSSECSNPQACRSRKVSLGRRESNHYFQPNLLQARNSIFVQKSSSDQIFQAFIIWHSRVHVVWGHYVIRISLKAGYAKSYTIVCMRTIFKKRLCMREILHHSWKIQTYINIINDKHINHETIIQ